jgi:hypothetical protein
MKTSLAARSVNRTTARNCILINQLATPGLGSIMAGRRIEGIGQLFLSISAFLMVIGWFVLVAINTYNAVVNGSEPRPVGWLGEAGGLIFVAAWLWALYSSIRIHQASREAERPDVPPRLS